jgi:hypothetical protein
MLLPNGLKCIGLVRLFGREETGNLEHLLFKCHWTHILEGGISANPIIKTFEMFKIAQRGKIRFLRRGCLENEQSDSRVRKEKRGKSDSWVRSCEGMRLRERKAATANGYLSFSLTEPLEPS